MNSTFLKNVNKIQTASEIFTKWNDYSTVDHDAIFICMQDDCMKNGQLNQALIYKFQQ